MIENNQYGMGTAVTRAAAAARLPTVAADIPGKQVDGMDALAVRAAEPALEHCRSGKAFISK